MNSTFRGNNFVADITGLSSFI